MVDFFSSSTLFSFLTPFLTFFSFSAAFFYDVQYWDRGSYLLSFRHSNCFFPFPTRQILKVLSLPEGISIPNERRNCWIWSEIGIEGASRLSMLSLFKLYSRPSRFFELAAFIIYSYSSCSFSLILRSVHIFNVLIVLWKVVVNVSWDTSVNDSVTSLFHPLFPFILHVNTSLQFYSIPFITSLFPTLTFLTSGWSSSFLFFTSLNSIQYFNRGHAYDLFLFFSQGGVPLSS